MTSALKFASAFVASLTLTTGMVGHAADGGSILFIGNSFTFGSGSAVRYYRNHTVTDLNHETRARSGTTSRHSWCSGA